jgi:hypothetical protein
MEKVMKIINSRMSILYGDCGNVSKKLHMSVVEY